MYAAYYMKEGQTFQKAGDEAKAAENYTKVVNLTTKSFKTQGLASLLVYTLTMEQRFCRQQLR